MRGEAWARRLPPVEASKSCKVVRRPLRRLAGPVALPDRGDLKMFVCIPIAGANLLLSIALVARAAVPEGTRTSIDGIMKQKGSYLADEGVYKFVLPREAAIIVQDYESMSPNLGFNSWIAFTSAVRKEAVLTGELLLLPNEVDSVLSRALDTGLEITGLAESSMLVGRRLYTLDFTGAGTFTGLSKAVRSTMDEIEAADRLAAGRSEKFADPNLPEVSTIDPRPLDDELAMRGTISCGVYKAAIERRALVDGEQIGGEMGMTSWVSISGTNNKALAHGELLATHDELQSVLKAFRSRGASVASIRKHSIGEHPEMIYVRFWKEGPALDLAKSLRFVLEVQVGNLYVKPGS